MPSVFLSHSSKDKDFVRKVADRLVGAGATVWIDEAELDIGDSLIEKIGEGIRDCDFVVAVISRNSVQSNWVQKELSLAMTREIHGRRIRVLPIVIDDCKSDMPFFLTDKLYADFTQMDSFESQFDRLLRAIFRRHPRASISVRGSLGIPIGEVDVGSVVHDRGGDWIALRWVGGGRTQGLKFLVIGFSFLVGATLLLARVSPEAKPSINWFFLAGICVVAAGSCLISMALWLKKAIDEDKNILLQLEAIGEEEVNIFTSKWKQWFHLSKSSVRLRVAMWFSIGAYAFLPLSLVCLILAVIALAVVQAEEAFL